MEKLNGIKDKCITFFKKIFHILKTNPFVASLVAFGVAMFVLILVAMLVLKEYVISVCVLIIIETMMAVLLHKGELWKHAVLVVAHIIAGVIIDRLPIMIICIIAYVVAMFALHFMFKKSKNGPKA